MRHIEYIFCWYHVGYAGGVVLMSGYAGRHDSLIGLTYKTHNVRLPVFV